MSLQQLIDVEKSKTRLFTQSDHRRGLSNSRLFRSQDRGRALLHALSIDGSSGLFSRGLTVDRITMILLRRSNQNGAPREMAAAVKNQPRTLVAQPSKVPGTVRISPGSQPTGRPSCLI